MELKQKKPSISQASFVYSKSTKLSDDYKIMKKLGAGAFSEVFLIQDKVKGSLDCVKVISKKSLSSFEGEDIMNEIKTLSEMDHPNIMKVKGYYDTKNHLYIISEYLSGGELFDRIVQAKNFTEMQAAQLMDQILSAVSYLHKHGIIHRDLKPENICFETSSAESNIKIIDFGTSKKVTSSEKLHNRLGTAYYIAPEVLAGSYDFKCDIWSCGIIMYVFLYGVPPFNGKTDNEIFDKIKSGNFKFPDSSARISNEAKDLISQMLTKNPDKRPTGDAVLQHPWFQKMRSGHPDLKVELETINTMVAFQSKYEFQKAVLLYFVSFFDLKDEKKQLLAIFKEMDLDHDGQLDRNELIQAYNKVTDHPDAEAEVEKILEKLDVNKSQQIDFSEFLLATVNYKKDIHDKELHQIFDSINKTKNGFLSKTEIAEFFGLTGPEKASELQMLIDEVDENKDGVISYDEFVSVMNKFLNA